MQRGEGREKKLPCYDLKEYTFAGFLRGCPELGLAEGWERSPGPRASTSIGNRVPLPAGGSYPGKYFTMVSRQHRFQAGFQLATKTKDALYVLDCLCQDK